MEPLSEFLEEKVKSVEQRIREATGVAVEPIYYSAGYKEEGEAQGRPYNLSKLLYYIVRKTPSEKRAVYVNNVNENPDMWRDDDELLDYGKETRRNIIEAVIDGASRGAEIGGNVGRIFGETGERIGRAIGGLIGAVGGFFGF